MNVKKIDHFCIAVKDLDAARKVWEPILGKASPDVWTDLGIMHREDKQPKKALDAFNAALAINPRHENALYNMGVVQLHDTGDKAGAAATWGRLIEINPNAKTPDGRPLSGIVAELKQ